MNKESLGGTGKVFGFTLRQMLRQRANIIMFVILAVLVVALVPVASIVMGGTESTVSEIAVVHVQNETEFTLDMSGTGEYFAGTSFVTAGVTAENFGTALGEDEALVRLAPSDDGISFSLQCAVADNSKVSESELTALEGVMTDMFNRARYSALNVSEEQVQTLYSGFSVSNIRESAYLEKDGPDFGARYTVQYVYAIVVMIISFYSAAFIIRAIVEEKSSKLVDMLMISVKPLALVVGKILATMAYIFGTLISLVVLFFLSYFISGNFLDLSPIGDMLTGMGLTMDFLNLGPAAIIITFVSIVLAYLTFSLLAGLSGAGCSTMEEIEGANMTVMFTVLGAYIVSCFMPAMEAGGSAVGIVLSIIPLISVFCMPTQFITGGIGIGIVCISWVVQIALILLLAAFTARVYRGLIMHSGSRLGLRQIFNLYGKKSAKEAV